MSKILTKEIRNNVAELFKCETIKNRQSDMLGDRLLQFTDVDPCLAKNIYDILNGKTDEVLPYDVIKRLMDEAKHNMISVGYGVFINKNLEICITKSIDDGLYERVDFITPDIHEAVLTCPFYYFFDIDMKKDNTYDNKKINALQEYIKGYFLEEEKSKKKKLVK